ncbi:hypothetical protein ACMFMG_000382 [Clarireedia jacksonii]
MADRRKLQFVWPKDGHRGRGHRGFFGRLNNVVTNRGPDIFIQRQGSKTAILPDVWGNWDSYHDKARHDSEEEGGGRSGRTAFGTLSRGYKRYDPYSRKYVEWAKPHDWNGHGVGNIPGEYPRFTRDEAARMKRAAAKGHRIDLAKLGKDWNHNGPNRFRQEYDEYWQHAHRLGENARQGLPRWWGPNPYLRMHQEWPDDMNYWGWLHGIW